MRLPRTALLLAAALLGAVLVTPSVSAPAPVPDGSVSVTYTVPTRHGPLALYVVHPTYKGKLVRAHGILTLTPYSVLGRNGDASTWLRRGYARMTADVVGTGDSGGCYDYGGKREQESGYDLVQWIAKQPWSLGRVGMIGGSYDGTTAFSTAVMRPPALATIVPIAAISRWYDYAYSGGRRYTWTSEETGPEGAGAATDEGFDTPLAFSAGLAVPPPTDVDDPGWAERVRATMVLCDEVQHLAKGYSAHPDYDAFWKERDFAARAGRVTIPIYVLANWGDYNVKQETGLRFFDAAVHSKDRRMLFGSRWSGHGGPGGDSAEDWMDRWVKGVHNGIENRIPVVGTRTADSTGRNLPAVTAEPRTRTTTLGLTSGYALTAGATGTGTSLVPVGVPSTETVQLADLSPGSHGAWSTFVTAPLAKDLRIVGAPVLTLRVRTGRTWLPLAVSLADVDPATGGAQVGVSRGWLDTRWERGLDAARPFAPGAQTHRVALKPADYTFRAGHRIALVVAADQLDWVAPAVEDGVPANELGFGITLGRGGSSLRLPVLYSSKT